MIKKINDVYNQCEGWSSRDIDRLVDELKDLSDIKYTAEEASQAKWEAAGKNINNFLTK